MRTLGWACVVLGVLVFVVAILAGLASFQASASLCAQGKTWACLKDGAAALGTGTMWAAIIAGFGILILAIRPRQRPLDPTRVPCPYCAEDIKPEARRCPYCQSDLTKSNIAERLRPR